MRCLSILTILAGLAVGGCDKRVEVEVSWGDLPAHVDAVTVAGASVHDGDATTEVVFPLHVVVPEEDTFAGIFVHASYRGLEIASGSAEPEGGAARIALVSATGFDALRPCEKDAQCATGTCGPKRFSDSLWSCVTSCTGGLACPGGSTCDPSTGVCLPACTQESDCARRGPNDLWMLTPWTCDPSGRCVGKTT